jgi:hypothetical protein
MKNVSSFTKLSRNEQRQIKGGQWYYCSYCTGINSNLIHSCDMALRICDTPDCGGYCNGIPNCFVLCSPADEAPFF